MSGKQEDEFLPDDELMEELPVDEFETGEDAQEVMDGENLEEMESPEAEENVPEFSEENSEEGVEEESEDETEEVPEKEKPIEYRPPRMDLYTMLLVLSLIFVSLAAVLHWLEVPGSEYGTTPWKKNSPLVTAPRNP